ncbi:hypothetical protein [Kribbella sp. CA-294648]|uniref:hypothetical protein n=1 Tax=Kribbella sp. CA-294648 TaxID=3239948 RepID=UPI003D8CF9E5
MSWILIVVSWAVLAVGVGSGMLRVEVGPVVAVGPIVVASGSAVVASGPQAVRVNARHATSFQIMV